MLPGSIRKFVDSKKNKISPDISLNFHGTLLMDVNFVVVVMSHLTYDIEI